MLPELTAIPLQFDAPLSGELLLLGRLVFGGVLAFMGLNHFLDAENMAGYAGAMGVPAPTLAVTFSGGMLLFGGLGIATGVYPTLAAGAIITFLAVTTVTMHAFWNAPEDQRQRELTAFLKNVGLLGAAIGLLALTGIDWPYALNVGLF